MNTDIARNPPLVAADGQHGDPCRGVFAQYDEPEGVPLKFEGAGMKNCCICRRPLEREAAPFSENCGGDCLSGMIDCEDDEPAPEHLPVEELRAWIAARDLRHLLRR